MEKRPENRPVTDPIETKASNGVSNTVIIRILIAVAVVLAIVLGVILYRNSRLIGELQVEKEELTEQIVSLQKDYDSLSSDYDAINSQLDSSREEVNQLVERIRKTDATNRALIRKYQKELGTLRSIMKSYVHQIDSLNTLNHKLTVQAAAARKEANAAKKKNAELEKTVSDLSGKVETGSIVKGRAFKAEAYNKNGKVVDRAAATVDVLVSMSLVENDLAPRGPMRVYVIITDPEGHLLTNSESRSCNFDGSPLATSASRVVDYQGSDVDLGIYMKSVPKYTKGIYSVKVLTEKSILGETQFMLR